MKEKQDITLPCDPDRENFIFKLSLLQLLVEMGERMDRIEAALAEGRCKAP